MHAMLVQPKKKDFVQNYYCMVQGMEKKFKYYMIQTLVAQINSKTFFEP